VLKEAVYLAEAAVHISSRDIRPDVVRAVFPDTPAGTNEVRVTIDGIDTSEVQDAMPPHIQWNLNNCLGTNIVVVDDDYFALSSYPWLSYSEFSARPYGHDLGIAFAGPGLSSLR
jgi:hypothetical protein